MLSAGSPVQGKVSHMLPGRTSAGMYRSSLGFNKPSPRMLLEYTHGLEASPVLFVQEETDGKAWNVAQSCVDCLGIVDVTL